MDADLAKESAQLTALQIRQQLGTQALSLANQAPQIAAQSVQVIGFRQSGRTRLRHGQQRIRTASKQRFGHQPRMRVAKGTSCPISFWNCAKAK